MVRAASGPLSGLADPTRARIVSIIRSDPDGRARVGDLATAIGVTQPTISHHVKALVDDELLTRDPHGRNVWYSIRPERLASVDEFLALAPREHPDARARIAVDLSLRFAGRIEPATVAHYVTDSFALLGADGREVRPSRAARFAAERLEALARADERPTNGAPEVLFVCVQNAGRSQLAAALLRQLAGDRVRVRTAGSEPADSVRSSIVTVLDEVGVSIDDEFPKPLTDEMVRAADVVVTMGCGDACPVLPGRRYLDWELDDPVGRPLHEVRAIRDDIDARVRHLLAELT
ncbi:metalloregulator ArsR/SmtB family transcription factor [Homoserinibacter sp. GY 40078]|uniref:metalloregulator ArsR/SmtB family transcription factor n=1 Tax=Homoserinibacter sp. GY 40078 TaxID=2603275 RepID=UPI0011CB13DF|nr:metalloregulator ArsR/SmtB family transcription factor [Homoserinibacter sp. GY 40078]TXK19044.1 metalloregulator ArsR/SmtB family transcription factor [Homoserinibacter sp. GY 40078]